MSTEILQAIDTERDRLTGARDELQARIDRLAVIRGEVEQLNGTAPEEPPKQAEPKKCRASAKKKRAAAKKAKPAPKKAASAKAPTDEQRNEQAERARGRREAIVELARKKGGITARDVADAGIAPLATARQQLLRLSQGAPGAPGALKQAGERRDGPGRPSKLYKLATAPISDADDDGTKTGPERRVVEEIRKAGGSIDEGTLAFATGHSLNDLRTYASGLVRRSVIARREVDGATLYEVAAA